MSRVASASGSRAHNKWPGNWGHCRRRFHVASHAIKLSRFPLTLAVCHRDGQCRCDEGDEGERGTAMKRSHLPQAGGDGAPPLAHRLAGLTHSAPSVETQWEPCIDAEMMRNCRNALIPVNALLAQAASALRRLSAMKTASFAPCAPHLRIALLRRASSATGPLFRSPVSRLTAHHFLKTSFFSQRTKQCKHDRAGSKFRSFNHNTALTIVALQPERESEPRSHPASQAANAERRNARQCYSSSTWAVLTASSSHFFGFLFFSIFCFVFRCRRFSALASSYNPART